MKLVLVLIAFLLPVLGLAQGKESGAEREIARLFVLLKASGCGFNRNGIWYDGNKAVAHLKKKYDYLKSKDLVMTSETFIERAASSSSMSGKPYLVRCKNDAPVASSIWFNQQLRGLRRSSPSGA